MYQRKIKDFKKRYVYHLTSKDLGDTIFLKPSFGEQRCEDEPEGKRICVSTHPWKCFVAIPDSECYNLYRSVKPLYTYFPHDIGDAEVTGERWLFRKRKFERVLQVKEYSELSSRILKCIKRVHCGGYYQSCLDIAKDAYERLSWIKDIKQCYRKN